MIQDNSAWFRRRHDRQTVCLITHLRLKVAYFTLSGLQGHRFLRRRLHLDVSTFGAAVVPAQPTGHSINNLPNHLLTNQRIASQILTRHNPNPTSLSRQLLR
jgi:hypothetical protein